MSPSRQSADQELLTLAEQILATKSTCLLHEFKSILERECLSESAALRHRSAVIECLRKLSNLVPSKLLVNVLKKAIDVNDAEFCCSYVNHIQTLDESQAVDCIKFFLKEENQKQNVDLDSTNYDEKLDLIFAKKYDYRLLSSELKRLSSNEFLICANYLHSYLKNSLQMRCNASFDEAEPASEPTDASNKPNIIQITDLLCSFVDAHFTHITLTPKAQEIVADILSLIETQLDLFVDLISIESLLKEAEKNKVLPLAAASHNMRHYYIEVLKLV